MAKVNYKFLKQRKEAARKTRQQEKQDRKAASKTTPGADDPSTPADQTAPLAPRDADT